MLAMFPPRMLAATKNPGLMGLMAKSVVHEDQGVLQGSIMSLRVLAKVGEGVHSFVDADGGGW